MSNRSAQVLAATLAFLLIVLVGATIFILLSRPAESGPTPTATPSGAASFTPTVGPSSSASVLPTPSASVTATPIVLPTDTPGPTVEPTITPTPSPSPTPSPAPTPSPTLPPPTSPDREVTIVDFGLDRRTDADAVQRTVSFAVDGPSLISAELKDVSAGRVRMCLLREDTNAERECITARGGTLSRAVFDAGQTEWNVTLIGASENFAFATLTLRFNSLSPRLVMDSFRFNGTNNPEYNGVQVVLLARSDGNVRLHGDIDGPEGQFPWSFTVAVDDVVVSDQSGGPSASFDVSAPVSGGTVYTVSFFEPEASTSGGPALLTRATLTWP